MPHSRFSLTAWPLALALGLACTTQASASDDAIVVTATRQPSRSNELLSDVSVLDRPAIEQAGVSSVAELLARQPGLQMASNGGAGSTTSVFIRGANPSHTVLLIDGLRVGSATTGAPTFEAIPLDQVERIEILRGPASALYGSDAIGGVIQIFTRRGEGAPRLSAFAGAGSYATHEASAGLAGGSERFSYSLRAGYLETEGFNAKPDRRVQPSANPDRDGSWNKNLSASLAFRPAPGHEVGATLLNADAYNQYDNGLTFDNRIESTLTSAGAYTRNALTDAWTSTLRVGRSTDDATDYAATTRNGNSIRTDQDQLAWQNDLRLPVGRLLLGAERLEQDARSQGKFTATRQIDSVFAGWTGVLGAHRLQVNLRHDDNSQFGGKTTGFAAWGLQLDDAWRAHLSAGTAFKAPTFNQLYFPNFGNPALAPEEALNREAGIDWEAGVHRAALVAFDNRVDNLIVSSGTPARAQNVGKAELRGVTVSYDGVAAATEVGVSVDFLNAKDATQGQPNSGKRLNRRAEKQLSAHAGRRYGNLDAGLEWQVVGARFDDLANRNRLGGYALLHATVGYQLAPAWRLEVRGSNLTDKRYETTRGFGTAGAAVFVGVRYASR